MNFKAAALPLVQYVRNHGVAAGLDTASAEAVQECVDVTASGKNSDYVKAIQSGCLKTKPILEGMVLGCVQRALVDDDKCVRGNGQKYGALQKRRMQLAAVSFNRESPSQLAKRFGLNKRLGGRNNREDDGLPHSYATFAGPPLGDSCSRAAGKLRRAADPRKRSHAISSSSAGSHNQTQLT